MLWLNIAHASSTFMPPQGSTFASMYDALYEFLVIASLIASILVIGGLIYFALKYKRKSDNDKTAYISHNATLEFLWSFIPFLIFMFVFAWGWYLYHDMRNAPEDALEVHVVGKKWAWDFLYKSGRKTSKEFYVPVNSPVKMIMTSQDVLHSFYIPSFRIKQDVVPGRYTTVWFEATKLGSFQVFCTEYCGEQHSAMLAKVHVLSKEDYENWLATDPYKGLSLTEIGQTIFAANCVACHNANAEKKIGPGFAGLWGAERQFENAGGLTVDADYLRESIINPNAKIVKGYPAAMTSFAGRFSEQELTGIIEYIKSLK